RPSPTPAKRRGRACSRDCEPMPARSSSRTWPGSRGNMPRSERETGGPLLLPLCQSDGARFGEVPDPAAGLDAALVCEWVFQVLVGHSAQLDQPGLLYGVGEVVQGDGQRIAVAEGRPVRSQYLN